MSAAAELLVGRPLRRAEAAIDVVLLDAALADAKDSLDAAIHAEMLRATQKWVQRDGSGGRPLLNVTEAMLAPLDALHKLGAEEAWNELERAGYKLRRFATIEEFPEDRDPAGYLRRNLTGIEVRIEADLVIADLSEMSADAVARALLRIPGGRDIASRIVSTALVNGLAQTWEQVEADVAGWEIPSVLDGATCLPCGANDGRRYRTLAEAHKLLPGGGPAIYCLGGGRCRCRLVPIPFGETV